MIRPTRASTFACSVARAWRSRRSRRRRQAARASASRRRDRPTPRSGSSPSDGDYKIGPEDVLDISVWKNPELSRTVPVRPDGKVSLPLVNDIQAAGLTPSRAAAGADDGVWRNTCRRRRSR